MAEERVACWAAPPATPHTRSDDGRAALLGFRPHSPIQLRSAADGPLVAVIDRARGFVDPGIVGPFLAGARTSEGHRILEQRGSGRKVGVWRFHLPVELLRMPPGRRAVERASCEVFLVRWASLLALLARTRDVGVDVEGCDAILRCATVGSILEVVKERFRHAMPTGLEQSLEVAAHWSARHSRVRGPVEIAA